MKRGNNRWGNVRWDVKCAGIRGSSPERSQAGVPGERGRDVRRGSSPGRASLECARWERWTTVDGM